MGIYIIPFAGTMIVMSIVSACVVLVMLSTRRRGERNALIWSVMALVYGTLGFLLAPYSLILPNRFATPGIVCGGMGLFAWFAARAVRLHRQHHNKAYNGPKCVACREPIKAGDKYCKRCGWQQPM
jgi:hypothetical protein